MNETLRSALSSWLAAQRRHQRGSLVSHGLAAPSGSWPACETAAMPPSLTKLALKLRIASLPRRWANVRAARCHLAAAVSKRAHNCSMLSCGRAVSPRGSAGLSPRPVAHDRCRPTHPASTAATSGSTACTSRPCRARAGSHQHPEEHPSGEIDMIGRNKIAVFALVRTSRLPQHVARNFAMLNWQRTSYRDIPR